jgi:hypothetical protein
VPLFSEGFPKQCVEAVGALVESLHVEHFLRRPLGNGVQLNSVFRLGGKTIPIVFVGVSDPVGG